MVTRPKDECGCKSGMVALLLALTASSYWFFYHEPTGRSVVSRLLYVFLISFACAVTGKIIGMIVPRIRKSRNAKRSSYGTRAAV